MHAITHDKSHKTKPAQCISNIEAEFALLAEQAAALTGFDIYIDPHATDIYNRPVSGCVAVMSRDTGDHTPFWDCYAALKKAYLAEVKE